MSSRNPVAGAAAALTLAFVALGILFGSAYALTDPGGAAGLAMTAAMVLPPVVLGVSAWRDAGWVLPVLLAGLVLLAGYAAVNAVEHLVDAPVVPIGALGLAAPLAVIGWRRPRLAGRLLVLVALVPGLSAALGAVVHDEGFTRAWQLAGSSSGAAALPLLFLGVLFLVAGRTAAPVGPARTPTRV